MDAILGFVKTIIGMLPESVQGPVLSIVNMIIDALGGDAIVIE